MNSKMGGLDGLDM